jgi:endonuclease-3
VAVALSAQATDKGVNKATGPLFKIADTPAKMAALGEAGIAAHIKTIGLWRNKAKNVFALSQILVAQHGGQVPRDRASLEALPGVGRKTANVVLAEAFGEHTIAVDTHVFRVANRTGLAYGDTPEEVEAGLMRVTRPEHLAKAHHWLILHGRYTCVARTPKCEICVISDLCVSKPAWMKAKSKAKAGTTQTAQTKKQANAKRAAQPARPSTARPSTARAKAAAKRSAAAGAKDKNK